MTGGRCDTVFQCRDLSDEADCPACAANELECDGRRNIMKAIYCCLPSKIWCKEGSNSGLDGLFGFAIGLFGRRSDPEPYF